MMLLWAAPVMLSSVGYYLMAVADLVDGAVALTAPAAPSSVESNSGRQLLGSPSASLRLSEAN